MAFLRMIDARELRVLIEQQTAQLLKAAEGKPKTLEEARARRDVVETCSEVILSFVLAKRDLIVEGLKLLEQAEEEETESETEERGGVPGAAPAGSKGPGAAPEDSGAGREEPGGPDRAGDSGRGVRGSRGGGRRKGA